MFDIKEYFENENRESLVRHDVVTIDDDLTHDINNLLSSRFNSLYRTDRYKHQNSIIEIIYPALQYPGSNPLLMTPDRIRYLLSFYPRKSDFAGIDKIVVRPRYIEIGNIELVSLYLRRKKILVLYLFHPHWYRMRYFKPDIADDMEVDLETIMGGKLIAESLRREGDSEVQVHPLWYFLSLVSHSNDDRIDKFFIKKDIINDRIYEILNDISFYYSRHGY